MHFWVERVDGQGFAEVSAAHIPDFRAQGFVGYRHKLCKQLVFFYLPGSLDPATESRVAHLLQPLQYTEDPTPEHLNLDLDEIPCDPLTMESQMPGVHSMERLGHDSCILVSERMVDGVSGRGCAGCEGDGLTVPGGSGSSGPVRTAKLMATAMRNVGPISSNQCRGKHKPWKQQDAPSDQRHRLWGQWGKLANFFNSHLDLLHDLEPPPATVPGKHSNLTKPDWGGLLRIAEDLCMWIHRNRHTAQWMVMQHSDDKDRLYLWKAALNRLDYNKVWTTKDFPREDETAYEEWLQAKECWLPR